jgi:hypothetical protein
MLLHAAIGRDVMAQQQRRRVEAGLRVADQGVVWFGEE